MSAEIVPSVWLPAGELAKRLSRNERWVYRTVKLLGIASQPRNFNSRQMPCYPPGTLEKLAFESERGKNRRRPTDIGGMSVQEMADELGRSYGWTKQTLARLKLSPTRYEQRRRFRTAIYSPEALTRLSQELAPPSDDWYNLNQLIEHTGLDREWIQRRLSKCGTVSEWRQSTLSGRRSLFYPPIALQLLKDAASIPAAGNWLTAVALARAVGKSENWTNRRLASPDLAALKELRLDDQRVPRMHYPPRVLEALQRQLHLSIVYPLAGSYLPISVLAEKVGRHPKTVKRYLTDIGERGEKRRDKKGRLFDHYPPRLVAQLRKHFGSRVGANTWMTTQEMATRLGVPREIVVQRLTNIPSRSQVREMVSTKRLELHYSFETYKKLSRSLQEKPHDSLVPAATAVRHLQVLQMRHGLTYKQLSDMFEMTTPINHVMKQHRIRRSLADKILATHDLSPGSL